MVERNALVVGAGIFGVTAALELRRRGFGVTLLEAGRLPHPDAASTDISKVCRMEYGPDELYMALMERSRDGWLEWNERWRDRGLEPLYRETGVVMVAREPMSPRGFEYESFALLQRRGHPAERLDADELVRRFPAWRPGAYVDGYFHSRGGYARSGRVVAALAEEARASGVVVREECGVVGILEGRAGVLDTRGATHEADALVVAAGSWTHELVPELAPCLRATGHAVFHLRPEDPELFLAERFPVFTADISRTGFYGFPFHPEERVVKIALHDLGVDLEPGTPREVRREHEERLRAFLPSTFPTLADAPIVATRLCPYSDTQDGDFWIAAYPGRPELVVAAGGSGHAFKFAPLLGGWIADALEGRENEASNRFRWRSDVQLERGREAARWHGGGEGPD